MLRYQEIECFYQIRPSIDYKHRYIWKRVNRTTQFRLQFTIRTSRGGGGDGRIRFDPESNTNKATIERVLIEPPNSDCNAPVVPVGEKDGIITFCIDFRKYFNPELITKVLCLKEGLGNATQGYIVFRHLISRKAFCKPKVEHYELSILTNIITRHPLIKTTINITIQNECSFES